jgi:predicted 2-oxoglutarate/Fe(II)-dependent dioxygenase YbiX
MQSGNPFHLTKAFAQPGVPIPTGIKGPPVIPDMQDEPLEARAFAPVAPVAREPLMPQDDTPLNMHREILIVPNFLSPDICNEYIEYIRRQQETDLSVFDAEATNKKGEVSWEVDKKTRDTQTVETGPIREAILDLMRQAVREQLNPFFNVKIKDSEMPQVLVYHPGGHYKPHIDGEALFDDGSGQLRWRRNVERDISLIIYLNQDFEGGELVFPKLAITIKPRQGMLLGFPSNHHFLHGVNPTTKGTRYAIVNWFSLGKPAEL